MVSDKTLEKRMGPILNPKGPDLTATQELVRVLSEASRAASEDNTRRFTQDLIDAIKEGYEIQSGRKYQG